MKFTLDWLKQHLDTTASLDEITLTLTALGLEVDAVTDRAKLYAPFHVVYVEKAEPHPDADRLKVCIIDTGKEKLQVVCGAPNARAGMKAVFAPAGSYIPGTGITIKKGNIRGQESNGMMVSEREMGLSDEHEGIIDVAAEVPVGTAFADLYGLNDPLIEIGLTPNRADCAGIRGIARDLAAAGMGKLKPLDEGAVKYSGPSPVGVTLKFDNDKKDACPLFLGRYIKGVKNGPSPKWMQDRLKAVGLRPISALVDVTNYLSLDLCRPLHVFDADKLKGGIHVRLARDGETLQALNGKEYMLSVAMTVVCDDSGVLGLGGVIGGEATGCTESTANVYLECAYFDPLRTARTGRSLQIDSDARYRFERGVDPAFTIPAIEIATRLIQEICGGEASEVIQAGDVPAWQRTISYDPAYLKQLSGFELEADRQKAILESLGFIVVVKSSSDWKIQPPSWRADVEGRADIVEEVLRINGYDNIPPVSMCKPQALTQGGETSNGARARKARAVLAARGMDECVTWSFMPESKAALFSANDSEQAAALKLSNAISADLAQMRPSILPNLVEAAERNRARGFGGNALFEVGPTFTSPKMNGQVLVAGGIRSGQAGPRHWADASCHRDVDVMDAKADAMAVIESAGIPASGLQVSRDAPAWYHPGRSGVLRMGANIIARFGELHPATLEALDIKGPVVGFEVVLDNIPQSRKKGTSKGVLTLSSLQPVSRDFAFLMDIKIEGDVLVRAIRGSDKDLIDRVDIFDIYSGKGVPAGKKSVAVAVTLQPRTQTLTEADLEAISRKIIDAVAAKTGGMLRS
ncbi:MAG: phenylalanine--tRNA ligase subunit beta [Micavibrio aeruginosavorus]|uniref:Phenylalanine--tRNA ligase beta subunit n=1 Tax=Micavibrio aeruginosavorus TaxID=349221 RepID=A0A7T5UIE4_9BACT|nr:MAG: phenylalanine--tRNA ligase subunit beta [Micavibrio aeruginosavorus]